jgi:hypothetical protein
LRAEALVLEEPQLLEIDHCEGGGRNRGDEYKLAEPNTVPGPKKTRI